MRDTLLIEGLGKRDRAVFDYIFNYYYSALCVFSLKYLSDRDAAEDLVQDFFVSLWIESSGLEIKSSLKSYLFTSIRNRCIDLHKHQKVAEKYRASILFSDRGEESATEHFLAESELRQALENGFSKLPPRCREIFEMNRLKGLSNQEIAEKLGLSKRTVELQISNALKILRKELAEFLPIWLVAWMIG